MVVYFFFVESDGFLSEKEPFTPSNHLVQRHYPGPGCLPCCIVINQRYRSLLSSIRVRGRAAHIMCREKHSGFGQVFVAMHGGHGEFLAPSLSDAAFLVKTSPRLMALAFGGDINVDQLPAMEADPFKASPTREFHHFEQCAKLAHFLDILGLGLCIPSMQGLRVARVLGVRPRFWCRSVEYRKVMLPVARRFSIMVPQGFAI